jgi:hypothetical protein
LKNLRVRNLFINNLKNKTVSLLVLKLFINNLLTFKFFTLFC